MKFSETLLFGNGLSSFPHLIVNLSFTTGWVPLVTGLICLFLFIFQLRTLPSIQSALFPASSLVFTIVSNFLVLGGIIYTLAYIGQSGCFIYNATADYQDYTRIQYEVSRAAVIGMAAILLNFSTGLLFLINLENDKFLGLSSWSQLFQSPPVSTSRIWNKSSYVEILIRVLIASAFVLIAGVLSTNSGSLDRLVVSIVRGDLRVIDNAVDIVDVCNHLGVINEQGILARFGVDASEFRDQLIRTVGLVCFIAAILYVLLFLWLGLNTFLLFKARRIHFHAWRRVALGTHYILAATGFGCAMYLGELFGFGFGTTNSLIFANTLTPGTIWDISANSTYVLMTSAGIIVSLLVRSFANFKLRRRTPKSVINK